MTLHPRAATGSGASPLPHLPFLAWIAAALLVAGSLLAPGAARAAEHPRVTIAQGVLEGRAADGVEVYKGIPFAAPPVGDGRWAAPRPAAGWSGPRDAGAFGPVCPQARAPSAVGPGRAQSEDCLTLNVWRPEGATKAPVMVWIHGGANRFGSGADVFYNGEMFARRGVVLVTINYRLGLLGFFAHPSLGKEANLANYGLLDQIAALRWVRENIGAFGGDPDQVTIFGESAGGGAVLNLMASPAARGLFHRATVQSGGGLRTRAGMAQANTQGRAVADALGLKGGAATPDALRAVPAERFVDPSVTGAPQPGFGAVVGGAELPEAPLSAIRAGRAAKVPLMIGANSWEGSLVDSFRMEDEAVIRLMGGDLPMIKAAYGAEARDRAAYARSLYGDVIFVYPAREIARAQARQAPSFLYYFDYVPERLRDSRPGVFHAQEIPYVFGGLQGATASGGERDKAMAAGVNGCWIAFARGGDPAGDPFCAAWSAYDARQDNWFVIRDPPASASGVRGTQLKAITTVLINLGLE